MSLVICPECGHEISNSAVACPQCGRPINASPPVVERKVVVAQPTPQRDGSSTWVFIPIAIIAVIVLSVLFYAFIRSDDTANANIRVTANTRSNDVTRSASPGYTVPGEIRTQPAEVHTTTIPGTSTTGVSAPPNDKGTVSINASITTPTGPPQAAKSVRFYLLDKDIESILSEARMDPIEGNTLSGSLGLALIYPERFGSFRRDAMKAISEHTKYSGTTDGRGIANFANVDPKEYYLFSIARVGNGFALWDSPISITAGQNQLNLSPQDVTEIPSTNG